MGEGTFITLKKSRDPLAERSALVKENTPWDRGWARLGGDFRKKSFLLIIIKHLFVQDVNYVILFKKKKNTRIGCLNT